MPRETDPFRNYVEFQRNNKWKCQFCKKEYAGSATRIKAHLAGVGAYGINDCKDVDEQVRSEALKALKVKTPVESSNRQGNVEEAPHQLVIARNEDGRRETSLAAMPCPNSDAISTVAARSSDFLPLYEMNMPSQYLPTQNMITHGDFSFWTPPSQFHAGVSNIQPQNLNYPSGNGNLAALTNMPWPVNAEEGEPNTEVPQGNEGSIDNIKKSKIGKIYLSSKIIGKGSNGTIVIEGKYEERPAAVKRLVQVHCDVAEDEMKILRISDLYENIVRYYGFERDRFSVYLALELCTCTLDDLIQAYSDSSNNPQLPDDPASLKASVRDKMQDCNLWRADGHPSPTLLKLMRDMVSGLSQLHALGIIHRDLKPTNVLITKDPLRAKLSDMGLSRCLPDGRSSLGYPATSCGTKGYQAPEVSRDGGRQTQAMDLFSLGCVLFFCVTRGRHLFGENIASNNPDLFLVKDMPEAHDLISCLLSQDSKLRPTTLEVLQHPLFWTSRDRLTFLYDVSNEVDAIAGKGSSDLLEELKKIAQLVFDKKWTKKMDDYVMKDLCKYRRYDESSIIDLLRVVRNKFSHLKKTPKNVKAILGSDYNELDAYFAKRFPRLLIESYKVVSQSPLKEELLAGVLRK